MMVACEFCLQDGSISESFTHKMAAWDICLQDGSNAEQTKRKQKQRRRRPYTTASVGMSPLLGGRGDIPCDLSVCLSVAAISVVGVAVIVSAVVVLLIGAIIIVVIILCRRRHSQYISAHRSLSISDCLSQLTVLSLSLIAYLPASAFGALTLLVGRHETERHPACKN